MCLHSGKPLLQILPATLVIVSVGSQPLSVATGSCACAAAIPATFVQLSVVFIAPGTVTHVGAVLSDIVITCVTVLVAPHGSVANQVVVNVPVWPATYGAE